MIVTISGRPSSGKSCVAKQLAKELGYRHFSAGDMQRQIAKEMGLTILELGILEQKDDSYDRKIDAKTRRKRGQLCD
jgi:cytidylate kinase